MVLGSDGQIGRPLVAHLESLGHKIIGVDVKKANCDDLRYRRAYFDHDIKWADFVFFFAFDVGGSKYLRRYQNSVEFIENNLQIMQNVFYYLKYWAKPFIFASSQMSNMINSPYGLLKRIGECYTNNLHGIYVKFWNVYGHEEYNERSHVITDFLWAAETTNMIHMMTTGEEKRQFLHVDDCNSALVELMTCILDDEISCYQILDDGSERSYDITSFEWTSIYQVAKMISELYNDVEIIRGDVEDQIPDILNEPDPLILDYWKPQISLRGAK